LAVLLFTVILCIRKSGYHVDEIYTFGLSNSHFAPFLNSLFGGGSIANNVITKQDLLNYLTVSPNQRFDFASVFFNQSKDVHPPLHYCVINAVSSLFPGVFSKWLGLSVNLVFWSATLVLVYRASFLLNKNRRISAFTVAVYGLSQIALSSVLMIRMYALSTMLTVLLVYLLLKIEKDGKTFRYLFVILTVFAGALTHYNFIIFAFFLTAAYDLYLIVNKKYPQLFKFSAAALIGVFLMFLAFPYVLDQFAAKKLVSGETAITLLLSLSQWLGKIGFYSIEFVFGIPLLFLLFAEAVLIIIPNAKKEKTIKRSFNSVTFVLIAATTLSFLCIAITSPAHTARYICHLVPVAAIVLAKTLQKASAAVGDRLILKYRNAIRHFCVPAALIVGVLCSAFLLVPNFIYPEQKAFSELTAPYASSPCVVICEEEVNCLTNNTAQLVNFDSIFITNGANSEELKEYVSESDADNVVVYIEEKALSGADIFTPEELLKEFTSAFPEYGNARHLYTKGNGGAGTYSVYVLNKI